MAIGYMDLKTERRLDFLTRWRDSLIARMRREDAGDFRFMTLAELSESVKRGPERFSGSLSSDDLKGLLGDLATKRFLDFDRAASATFRAVTAPISLRDFRTARWVAFEFPNLLAVGAGGEVKVGTLTDRHEPIVVESFARITNLSREAIVNDDVAALDAIPREANRAAVARQSALFWTLVQSNAGAGPVTRDGNNFFDATNHGNVGSTGALSDTTLAEAMQLLRSQSDDQGNEMGLEPALLVVAPSDEYTARKLLEDAGLRGKVRLLVEPRVSGAFYLFADPSAFPAFVRGTIGDAEPRFIARSAFQVGQPFDGVAFKLALDVGFGAGDWRGAVRTPTS